MPANTEHLNTCSFIGRKGPCGRPCFRSVCGTHRGKKPLTLCLRCGERGTTAPHGYCMNEKTGCRWKAQYESRLMKAERDATNSYIDELLSLDLGTTHVDQCPRTITTPVTAESARNGSSD